MWVLATLVVIGSFAQGPVGAQLKAKGIGDAPPLLLSAADLKKMPRKRVDVINLPREEAEVFEGVPLADLLQRVGVPHGEKLRGAAMACTW
jgi:hypothetical protein